MGTDDMTVPFSCGSSVAGADRYPAGERDDAAIAGVCVAELLVFQGERAFAELGGLLIGPGCLGSARVHFGRVADVNALAI
jgi:hypothetical protein